MSIEKIIEAHKQLKKLFFNKTDEELIEMIRKELALDPWDEVAIDVVTERFGLMVRSVGLGNAFKEIRRQTGRTTKIICNGLVRVLRGYPVCFESPNSDEKENMFATAYKYAQQLGLDMSLIRRDGEKKEPNETLYIYRDHDMP